MIPKWVTKPNQAKKSRKHEERLATQVGGKRTPRSGGFYWSSSDHTTSADISHHRFFIEHKYTEKPVLSLKSSWLEKVTITAKRHFKLPAVMITFHEKKTDWLLIPYDFYKREFTEKTEILLKETTKKSISIIDSLEQGIWYSIKFPKFHWILTKLTPELVELLFKKDGQE